MTKAAIGRLVDLWQSRLGLERWKITVDWEKPAVEGRQAEVEKSAYYDTGTIRLEAGWAGWDADTAAQAIVHELLHLCHRDIDESVRDLDGQLHRDAEVLFERRYRQHLEQFVDRMATYLIEIAP